jgi:hypothetical protein
LLADVDGSLIGLELSVRRVAHWRGPAALQAAGNQSSRKNKDGKGLDTQVNKHVQARHSECQWDSESEKECREVDS